MKDVRWDEGPDRLPLWNTRAYGLLASWKGKLNKEPPIAPGRLPVREAESQALWVKDLRLDEMTTFQKSGAHLGGSPRHLPSTLKAPPSPYSHVRSASHMLAASTLQGLAGLPVISSSVAAPTEACPMPQEPHPCWSLTLHLLLSLAPPYVLCSLPLQLPDGTLAGCSVRADPSCLSRLLRGWTTGLYTAQDSKYSGTTVPTHPFLAHLPCPANQN